MRENSRVPADREIVHQPVPNLAGFGGQVSRNLAVKHRFASAQNFLQQAVRMHAMFVENLGSRLAPKLFRRQAGHSRKGLIEACTAKFGIKDNETNRGR